jgi:hypothetical protein
LSLGREARRARYLLACGLAPALFVAVVLVEGAVRPGYDPLHHFGSELSLGSGGWMQVTNFIGTGLLVLGFAAGMRRALGSGRGSVAAPILTAVFGVTLIVAGIFPTDPKPGYPPGTTGTTAATTVPGMIHDLNALPCFAALTAAMLMFAVRFAGEPGRRVWMWCSLAIALAVAVTFVLSGVLFSQAAAAGTLDTSYHGLVQRFTIALGFGWLSVIALLLLRERPGRPALQPERAVQARRVEAVRGRVSSMSAPKRNRRWIPEWHRWAAAGLADRSSGRQWNRDSCDRAEGSAKHRKDES